MKKMRYLLLSAAVAGALLADFQANAQCNLNVDISVNPPPPFCPGTNLTLTAEPYGNGTPPYTYLWDNGATTQSISVPAPSGSADYLVTVTDATGCEASEFMHIKSVFASLLIVFSSTPICEGATLPVFVLNAPPGSTVLWSTGETTETIEISTSGTYSVTVSHPNYGCTGTVSEFVEVEYYSIPPPNPEIIGPANLCAGQSATLSFTGSYYSNVWHPGGSNLPTLTVSSPGIYWLEAFDFFGCSGADTIEILPGGALPVLVAPPALCTGQSGTVEVANAAAFTEFDWSNGATTPSISISAPGTYAVTVTESGGCTATGSVTVNSGSANFAISGVATAVTSCSSPNGAVDLTTTPSATYTYDWSNGATTEDIADISAGNFTVTVTEAGGCSVSASFSVENNTAPPVASASATPATCSQNNGAVDLSVSPSGSYDYSWSNGVTTEDLSDVPEGSYSATVTSTASGCSSTVSAIVSNTTISLTISGNVTQPSGGQNNGAIDVTVSPSGTYIYNWSNGATTEDLTGLGAGTYVVTVSAGGTCTETASFTLSAGACPIFFDYNSYYNFCDPTLIYVEAIPIGGTPPYTYSWETGETTQIIIVPNAVDDYFVTITDATGCVVIDHAHIKPQAPGPYYPYNSEGCEGDTVTLFMNWVRDSFPGTTYLWSTGATTPTIDITTSGTYTVTITSPPNGCTYVSTIEFTLHPVPEVEIVGPTTLCPGNSATLSVTGGNFSSVYWFPPELYQPSITVTDPGTYIAYAWTVEGEFCFGTDTITIVPGTISPPTLTGPATLCSGQSGTVSVSNSSEYTQFMWSNGATTPSITVSAPGTYDVTVTNAGGCTATGSFNVTNDPNAPSASTDPTPAVCGENNGGVDLTISPPGSYTYLWSNGSTSEDLSNLPGGTYSVTVTSAAGCTDASAAVVAENTVTIALTGATTPNISCLVNTGAIDLTVSPPGVYTFFWSNGATTEDLFGVAPGSYSVTVSTGVTCSSSASFSVENSPVTPNLAADPIPATCNQSNGSIDLFASGSNSPFTFDWSNGSTSEDLDDLLPGTYSVTVTGSNGCTSTTSATVNCTLVPVTVAGAATPNTACGESNGSIEITATPPGVYAFSWSNGATTEDLYDLSPGTYSVTATLGLDCIGTAIFVVEDNSSQPVASGIVLPNTSCNSANGAIDLSVSPPGVYTFSWSNGATSEDLTGVGAGSYSVTVSGSGGCTSTGNFAVANNVNSPAATASVTAASCGQSNGTVDLTVTPSGNYVFLWSNGATSEDLQNLAAGTYFVTVTGSNGCTSNASADVPNDNTGFNLAATTAANTSCTAANGAVDLTISPSGTYAFVWSNGATSEDLQNVAAGNYSVTVTGSNGCTATASAEVQNSVVNFTLAATTAANTSCTTANGAIDLTISPSGTYIFIWSNGAASEDLQDVSAGSYLVTVTAAGNCTGTANFVVANNSGAPSLAVAASPGFCGQNSGGVDLTVSPSGVYNFNWSNGATGEDLQNVASGSYSVTVTGATGCTSAASATVADSTVSFSAIALVAPNSSCFAANGSIDLSVSVSGNFNYLWSNGATSQDLQNLPAGDYSVTISQGLTCLTTATYTVNGSVSSPVFSQNITPASCGASTGIIDLTVTPALGNNFIWSNGSVSEDLLAIPPGTYAVTVTASNGCTTTGFFDVPNNSNNFSLSGSAVAVTSCSASNGSVNLTVSPAGGYAFLWSNGATSEDLQNLPAGTYSVTVNDGTNCTVSANYVVNSNTLNLTLAGVATPVACFGGNDGAINLTPGGGGSPYVFSWSPALPGNPQNPVQLAAGGYSVTATDANDCSASANFTIMQPASGVAIVCQTTANASEPGLADGSGSVSAQGGSAPYFISWTPGGGVNQPMNGGSFDLNNLTEGNYSVTVTDNNGCPENCSFSILSEAQPCVADVGTMQTELQTACENDCISVNYSDVGQVLENGDLLQFVLHQGSANQIVGEIARNDEPVFCFDASQMMFGTTYFISAVVGDSDPAGNVILNDPCTAVSLGTPVIFYEKPVASAAGGNITCLQNEAQLSGASSLPGSQFQWATQDGIFGGGTTAATATATAAGTYVLFVTKNGCADTASVQVLDLRNQPVAAIDSDSENTLNCTVDAISLTGSYSGSSDGSMFWFSNGNLIGMGSLLTVEQAGVYQFVILDTLTFCADTTELQIFENQDYPNVFVNVPPVLNCQQTSVTLIGGSSAGGIEFAWATIAGADTSILGMGTSLTVSAPGTYFLIATDSENGCANAASQAVFANTEPPQADAGENQTLDCHETPVTLTGSGFPDNVSFFWSSPGVAISSPGSAFILVTEPGVYTLVVMRLDNFCKDTATVQVFDYQTAAQAQATVESPTCHGSGDGSIFVETDPAHAPYHFVLDGKSYGGNPHLTPLSGGTYSLQVTDNQGCTWTAEVVVPDPPVLELNLGADFFVELGQTVTLTVLVTVPPSALEAVFWQPDSLFDCPVGICLQQEITPVEQTEVRLTVIDTFGCMATDRLMLFVKKDVDVYIPNVFSPDGDGVNDVFTIFGDPAEIEEIVEFQIFQRWGEFVYKYEHFPPNDPLYGWDGTYNGTPLNSQVFVYWVVVKFTDGTERFFEGGITLLR